MRNDKGLFVGIAMLMTATLAGPPRAQAQERPDPKPATPASVARGIDHLDLSVGGGVVLAPRPYVGASEEAIPIPVFNVRYKWLFVEGIRGGAQFLRQGKLAGNVYLQANFEGLKADDSPSLAGMENRAKSADAGVEVVYRARPSGIDLRAVLLAGERLRGARATGSSRGRPALGQTRGRRWRRAEWIWNA